MRKTLLTFSISFFSLFTIAQDFTEWTNPKVNQKNRAPMRAAYFAYENTDKAVAGLKENSENFLSLNGVWKFNWVRNADQRPTDFYTSRFNDKGWDNISVPGIWEMNGYGDPLYVNQRYEWDYLITPEPGVLPIKDNHVGSYRKTITIPDNWNKKKVYIHFGAVASNLYLWVNGQFVGYGEDSKLESEFDITRYLKKGENLIAFQVFRWSDGKYLECQDFWRFSGVSRDVYLYARNPLHIEDYKIKSTLDDSYTQGEFAIDASFSSSKTGHSLKLELFDVNDKLVWTENKSISKSIQLSTTIPNVKKWSAEEPNLYHLNISLLDSKAHELEVIRQRIGFKRVEITNKQMLVNGQAILIKGVNRHEMDPDGGYYVTRERMEQDIRILKENNFNAVRTAHYPDDSYWYELCDIHGIYVVDEANVEAHGYEKIAQLKDWTIMHLERTTRMVQRDKNVPSIIAWSMGNESGDGINFTESYKAMKKIDNSRPIQYQRAGLANHTDIYCPFYVHPIDLEKYAKDPKSTKPLIQCEYAHAMGNSMGGFKEYWDLYRKYPILQGGFIWDFADQAIRDYRNGTMIYTYGGDYGVGLPSDNNFCNNGVFTADREPNPHLDEVRMQMQPIWTTPIDLKKGTLKVFNENFFTDLSDTYLVWEIKEEGKIIKTGQINELTIDPRKEATISLNYNWQNNGKEKLLNIYYKLKEATSLLPAGYIIAKDQLQLEKYDWTKATLSDSKGNLELEESRYIIEVKGDVFDITFDKSNGYLTGYEFMNDQFMKEGESLQPNFWRAPTDNDIGANSHRKLYAWRNPTIKLDLLEAKKVNSTNLVIINANYTLPELGAMLSLQYTINSEGEIKVEQNMKAGNGEEYPELMFRFGMQMVLNDKFDKISYYGRGPIENYQDRKYSTFIGKYTQTIDEQYYPYDRPQETGNKTDIRWWNVSQYGGRGLQFVSNQPFNATTLNRVTEQLEEKGFSKGQRHGNEQKAKPLAVVSIDKIQHGLGCIDTWWSLPLDEYKLPYTDTSFSFIIRPTL